MLTSNLVSRVTAFLARVVREQPRPLVNVA